MDMLQRHWRKVMVAVGALIVLAVFWRILLNIIFHVRFLVLRGEWPSVIFWGLLVTGIVYVLRAILFPIKSPYMICRECRTESIPIIDLRTKDEGYCRCCGAVMWTRNRGEPKRNVGGQLLSFLRSPGLKVVGETAWCPECQKAVSTIKDTKHAANYCSVCGVVLRAEQGTQKAINNN